MFSKSITNSSQFLMMPQSSQNLYFHLGMNADDDGFCEHFALMRMTDSKPDDLKILQAKGFVSVFDDKVLVITDWKENNYLRSDRYTPSKYLAIYKDEIERLSSGIPVVDEVATQVRLGKDRKGKDTAETSSAGVIAIINEFKKWNPSAKRWYGNKTQRQACEDLIESYGLEQILKVIPLLPKTNKVKYLPTANTALQLFEKYVGLKDGLEKMKNEKEEKLSKYKVAF